MLSSAQRFLKPLETKPAASVNTSENKHPAPRAVSSNCPHDLALHFSLSLSKLRHSDLLVRKDPPLPPKTRAEVPLSLGTEQLPAVWKVFSVFTSTCWNPARPPGYCGNEHGVAIWTESGPTSCSVWRPPFT